MSDKCRDGLLRFGTFHLFWCDKKQFAKRMRQMAKWAEDDCWPTEQPDWLMISRFNKGGGGPCAPRSLMEYDATFPLVPAVPNKECPCKD